MREAYERGKAKNPTQTWVKNNLSYEVIAKKMKDRICQLSLT